jgi:hypothetical protein
VDERDLPGRTGAHDDPRLRLEAQVFEEGGVDDQKPVAVVAPADRIATCWCAERS